VEELGDSGDSYNQSAGRTAREKGRRTRDDTSVRRERET